MTHRVMAEQETGEECCMYEGTRQECINFMNDNEDEYVEFRGMWIEEVRNEFFY